MGKGEQIDGDMGFSWENSELCQNIIVKWMEARNGRNKLLPPCDSNKTISILTFRCLQNSKFLLFVLSHRIFEHIYGALNIDKKIINCTVWW
jgi:hypothetical protein